MLSDQDKAYYQSISPSERSFLLARLPRSINRAEAEGNKKRANRLREELEWLTKIEEEKVR